MPKNKGIYRIFRTKEELQHHVLTDVVKEYMTDYSADLKDDKSMEYSRACLDRELKQYTGKLFVPEEERYK